MRWLADSGGVGVVLEVCVAASVCTYVHVNREREKEREREREREREDDALRVDYQPQPIVIYVASREGGREGPPFLSCLS